MTSNEFHLYLLEAMEDTDIRRAISEMVLDEMKKAALRSTGSSFFPVIGNKPCPDVFRPITTSVPPHGNPVTG